MKPGVTSTTRRRAPVDPRVLEAMLPYFTPERYGNPQSLYTRCAQAKEALDLSRVRSRNWSMPARGNHVHGLGQREQQPGVEGSRAALGRTRAGTSWSRRSSTFRYLNTARSLGRDGFA